MWCVQMGDVVVLKTAFKGRRKDCEPSVRAKMYGWAAMAAAGTLTEADWEAINRQRQRCLRCGAGPDLVARLMLPPSRMATQPAAGTAPAPSPPALRM